MTVAYLKDTDWRIAAAQLLGVGRRLRNEQGLLCGPVASVTDESMRTLMLRVVGELYGVDIQIQGELYT